MKKVLIVYQLLGLLCISAISGCATETVSIPIKEPLNLSQDSKVKKEEPEETVIDEISLYEEKPLDTTEENTQDEISPQLFSDEETSNASSESNVEESWKSEEEEDFEIPAFLRKQKF